jgi:hypothetical protein
LVDGVGLGLGLAASASPPATPRLNRVAAIPPPMTLTATPANGFIVHISYALHSPDSGKHHDEERLSDRRLRQVSLL